tara:strand:+ start:4706 stop:4894 length:189 start_codon:yes stop_codon:yes gene_type:complete
LNNNRKENMTLEIERVDSQFSISGNLYSDDEAMEIADFIYNILQAEAIAEQGADEYRKKFDV